MTHDHDIERALIAEALRRYDRFVARGLSVADFTVGTHVVILEACQRLWERGEAVSLGSVALALQQAGKGIPGGERGLADLVLHGDKVPDPDRLRELTRLRAVEAAAQHALAHARGGSLTEALAALADVDQLGATTQATRTGSDLAERVLLGLRDQAESDKRRVHLGLRRLDAAIGKLPVGAMMVVAADSNVGKSGVMLSMLLAMARANIKCGLISVEDPEDVTGARLLAAYTQNISSRELQHGRFESGMQAASLELDAAIAGVRQLGDRLMFEDRTGETELEVCAAMSRMAARGAKLVVVDYIQEVGASKHQQDRRNEVRWVTKRLKAHAKRLNVALVLVSQIARPKDGDEFRTPSKHALKESGDLVNSAEVILVLWREYAADDAPIHVKVAKAKWGGVGTTWTMQRSMANGAVFES